MKSGFPKTYKAAALILVLTLMNLYMGTVFAAPRGPQASGKITTTGNQSVLVNGTSTNSGATILTGATIETGDQVGATINLGSLGTVDIAPNTKLQIEFDQNGNMKVNLIQGCVITRNKSGNHSEIYTPQGPATSNDAKTKPAAVLDVCFPTGAPGPIVNQGAAANAGAGAGGGGGVGGGIGAGVTAGLIGGIGGAIILGIVLANRGDNPSPSS